MIIDKILNVIEKNTLEEYLSELPNILNGHNIEFQFNQVDKGHVSYDVKEKELENYIIDINLSHNSELNKIELRKIILKELSHIIVLGLPTEIPFKFKGSKVSLGRLMTRAFHYDLTLGRFNINEEKCTELLELAFQNNMFNNVAFMISCSCILDINSSVVNFFRVNNQMLSLLFKDIIPLKAYSEYTSEIKGDCKHLSEIQLAVKFLNRKVKCNTYNRKLKELLNLCLNYEKRILWIMTNT